jgi:hypothetical protein
MKITREYSDEELNYKLCYVDGGLMYFTSDFENQWGDDWDDTPYEHNAEPPYTDENIKLIKIYFNRNTYDWKDPAWRYNNSPFSVKDINSGAVAWLYNEEKRIAINAGETLKEVFEKLNGEEIYV